VLTVYPSIAIKPTAANNWNQRLKTLQARQNDFQQTNGTLGTVSEHGKLIIHNGPASNISKQLWAQAACAKSLPRIQEQPQSQPKVD
jgi:hypothetical protein